MSPEDFVGRSYGPVTYSTNRAVCDRFIVATGDDPSRWTESAPSSLAGAMLFAVAPLLLGDPELAGVSGSVIHGEQTFTWLRPIPIDAELAVGGILTRFRERGGVYFVGFDLTVGDSNGDVLTGSSLFLMSRDAPPAGQTPEETEPDPGAGSDLAVAGALDPPADGELVAVLSRSASRADLVRYAGASQDFNPIHWDHGSAVAAGLPGVVVHGLMQSAWLCQAVERHGAAVGSARFRYRAPLRPAVRVEVSGARTTKGWEVRIVAGDGTEHVSATFTDRD